MTDYIETLTELAILMLVMLIFIGIMTYLADEIVPPWLERRDEAKNPTLPATETPSDYISPTLGGVVAIAGKDGLARCQLINGIWHGWRK